ncbi:DNA primase [Chloroflexota bacterium]
MAAPGTRRNKPYRTLPNSENYKMGIIDEVKQRADIVEIIGEDVSLTKAGRTFKGLCPFHSEKHASFFVYPEQQSWHCFGACGTGGDVFSYTMKKQNIEFGEALRLLAEKEGVTIPSKFEPEARKEERERLYQANQAATQYFQDILLNSAAAEKARDYVSRRGFSAKSIADFQLGFSPNSWDALKQYLMERGYTEDELLTAGLVVAAEDGKTHDRFRNKLMFPILDNRGHHTGFGARVLDDSLPKYVNSPATPVFDKSSSLYGINLAAPAIREQNLAVIVEGYIDTITAHQHGFNTVVAPMGTAVTEKQVVALKRLTKNINVVFALDADEAGAEAMLRGVGYENTLDAEVKVLILPAGKDPDDVIKEDEKTWKNLVDATLPIVDYAFNAVAAELDLTTAKGKSSAVEKLLSIVAEMKDTVRQAHYLQKLARLVKVSEHTLETTISRMKPSPARWPVKEQQSTAVSPILKPFLSSPIEEYCLALLLQHHELKSRNKDLLPEYFQNTQNHEIFNAWQQTDDLSSLKEKVDAAIWEHLDYLIDKSLPDNQIEQRYNEYVLRLRKEYFRGLARKKGEALALEARSGGTAAELAKLEELGADESVQLGKVFTDTEKSRRRSDAKR